jgi:hypothetical protein
MSIDDNERLMYMKDIQTPEAVRAHGGRFPCPAHFVRDLGNNESIFSRCPSTVRTLRRSHCGPVKGSSLQPRREDPLYDFDKNNSLSGLKKNKSCSL